MQDAYVVDQMKKGSWTDIGYTAPSSKNFNYNGTTADWYAKATFTTDSPCDQIWKVGVTVSGAEATYKAETKCTNLTPNFVNIGAGASSSGT